jgi:cytochrome c553
MNFFRTLSAITLLVLTAFVPVPAKADALCPEVAATSWRSTVSHASIITAVDKQFDGDWSGYIAKWERELDAANDVYRRKSSLIVRIGSKKRVFKGPLLLAHIASLAERIEAAYCLRNAMMSQADANAAGPVPQRLKGRPEVGKKVVELAECADCHGVNGISDSETIPNLAGQDARYLSIQMKAFESRSQSVTSTFGDALRQHRSMVSRSGIVMRRASVDVAGYYQSLPCDLSSATAMPTATSELTSKMSWKLEICFACHGKNGRSKRSGVPGLAGQKIEYLVKQLRAFRLTAGNSRKFHFTNRRHHRFMSTVSGQLSNEDIREIAGYFSAQSCR